mgnify:CR=1 FL=1
MLIKVNSRMWENFNCVNSLSLQRCIRGTGKDVYIVNICVDGKEIRYDSYDSKEDAEKAMDELAVKINTAQPFKIKEE